MTSSSFAPLQRTYQRAGWFALATSALLLVGVIILWGGRATTEAPPPPVAVVPHAALDHWRAQEHARSAAAPEADAAAALDRWLAQNPTVIAIENVGQFDPQARFVLRGVHGGQLWIARDGSLWFDAARATDSGAWERQAARLRIDDPAGGVDIVGGNGFSQGIIGAL